MLTITLQKHINGSVLAFKGANCVAHWPSFHSIKPDYRYKYVILNCYRKGALTMKIKEFKNGAWTVFEKTQFSGMYVVKLYRANGDLADKVVCDDYSNARHYLKCFNAIAKNIHP